MILVRYQHDLNITVCVEKGRGNRVIRMRRRRRER